MRARGALQPLAWIDDASERGWATEWIAAILTREKIETHAGSQGSSVVCIDVTGLGANPRAHPDRLVGVASALLPKKKALQPGCLGGPYGQLLDAEFERLGEINGSSFRNRRIDRYWRCTRGPSLSLPSHREIVSTVAQPCSSSTKAGFRAR